MDINFNNFYNCTATFQTQICRKCLQIKLNGFRPVYTFVDITSNTLYKCTATSQTHCLREYSNISSRMNNKFYFISIYFRTNKIGFLNTIAVCELAQSVSWRLAARVRVSLTQTGCDTSTGIFLHSSLFLRGTLGFLVQKLWVSLPEYGAWHNETCRRDMVYILLH
jgi:hypothetical protein